MKLGMDMTNFKSAHGGGKDEVAYNLLRGFARLGCCKDIVCFCYPELEDTLRAISPELQIRTVPAKTYKRFVLRHWIRFRDGLDLRRQLKTCPVEALLFTNKESPQLRFPVKTFVITHDIQLFRGLGLKGHPKLQLLNLLDRLLIKREFRLRDRIICISDFDRSEVCRFIPGAAHKAVRIYDPICFRDPFGKEEPKRYITALNIQWVHKNIWTLIRAYARIADRVPWDLMLVGKKPSNWEAMARCAEEAGVGERVHFTGFVSRERLEQILAQTRLYVNTSRFEGFGMTAVEMIGWGIPTVVADNTAQREVTQGLCRYYSPTDDPEALAERLLDEVEHPTAREELDLAARRMRESYDYVTVSREYWNLMTGETL